MIKAVLFDFDETLQDRTAAFNKYTNTFVSTFLPSLSAKEKEQCRKDMVETGNGGYVNRVEWFNGLIKMWHWENSPSAEELARHYDEQFGFHIVMFKESVPLLKELQKRGYKTGVITNGPSVLQGTKMKESGLIPYCDIVVISGDLPFAKPDAQIFNYTAEKLGVNVDECVYVGDHPVNDIQGALDSGMNAIRMNWGWFKDKDLRSDVPIVNNIYDVLNYV